MFKKEDFKPGMLVVLRDGFTRVFIEHYKVGKIFLRKEGHMQLQDYDDELHTADSRWDIMSIYHDYGSMEINSSRLIWERKEVPEYTLAELKEKIGHDFKLKEEK